jgi:HAD superfamily hydrolase (TIGR01450 family)
VSGREQGHAASHPVARPTARHAAVPAADTPARLREALAGVRALLLDMDGVVVARGKPLPGAGEAVAALVARGIPFRFLTNSSLYSRESLSRRLTGAGIRVAAPDIVTALTASATLTAGRWPGRALYVLGAPDALVEFEGQRLLSDEEAADAARERTSGLPAADAARGGTGGVPGADATREGTRGLPVAAVIVGDAGPGFTFARLNTAFRLVRGGARLVAVHRNRWWLTPEGETLDSGAFVRAIEYAAGRRALLVGKPAPSFFEAALASLGAPSSGTPGSSEARPENPPGMPDRRAVLMVGDDLQSDVAAARRVGLRAAFVLSGRHGPADLAAARRRSGVGPDGRGRSDDGRLPDAVAPSLAEIVAALD